MTSPISSILEARAQRELEHDDAEAELVTLSNIERAANYQMSLAGIEKCGDTKPHKYQDGRDMAKRRGLAFRRLVLRIKKMGSGE